MEIRSNPESDFFYLIQLLLLFTFLIGFLLLLPNLNLLTLENVFLAVSKFYFFLPVKEII